MTESREHGENRYDYVQIRLLIDGNELVASVPSRDIPALIDRWFKAIGAGADQARIDALVQRMKVANDKLEATIQANTPTR
jgi:hypothetical protein